MEKNVIDFYVLCNKLKDVIRTGWKDWNVKRERVESIAEHVYGTLMLAIAMNSECNYDLDFKKVIYMLAVHELGEIVIGDFNPFEITSEEKQRIEHEAIHNIVGKLLKGEEIEELLLEFDERKTKEARFAHMCDKLECDIQCKLYDEQNCVDIVEVANSGNLCEEEQALVKDGTTWSELWLNYDKTHYNYDENFTKVADYLLNNNILDNNEEEH